MPFSKTGRWKAPTEEEKQDFLKTEGQEYILMLPEPPKLERNSNTKGFALQTSKTADIVIPIYRSAHSVKDCIESIIGRTFKPYNLILVDDYSNDPGIDSLLNSVESHKGITVLRHTKNKGFAATVNTGIAAGNGDYICVLNSDTIVTPFWLTKMCAAMEADERNQIVNPCTNNTALINIPMVPGFSYLDMNEMLESQGSKTYPEIMPTGFCFLLRRSLIDQIGAFDEGFHSYGEEALALNTKIPTPKGWTTVGQLKKNDIVFSQDGSPTKIIKTTDIFYNRSCYKITLDTKESFICDEGHNWTTQYETKKTKDLTTKDRLPIPNPVQYAQRELILDPYLFGTWLGDGHSNNARITNIDIEVINAFKSAGYNLNQHKSDKVTYSILTTDNKRSNTTGPGILGSLPNKNSFIYKLKYLNVYKNKHIPEDYLFNSINNRIALLQGLMDTDGYCSEQGRCVFSSSKKHIINQFIELIASLGLKPYINKPIKNNYRVTFRSQGRFPIFRLKRKQQNVKVPVRNNAKYYNISMIERVQSTPVKCIAVDNETNTFLAGNYIPTHNTDLWMRAIQTNVNGQFANYRAVLADDTYIFHERGGSFSQLDADVHMGHRQKGSNRFKTLYPYFGRWQDTIGLDAIRPLRALIPSEPKDAPFSIYFLVRSTGMCGGMKWVADIVNYLIETGINAKVAQVKRKEEANATTLESLRSEPIIYEKAEHAIQDISVRNPNYLVCCTADLLEVAQNIRKRSGSRIVHFVQADDEYITPQEFQSRITESIPKSNYTISSSQWITTKLQSKFTELSNRKIPTVIPGVDPVLFHPRNRASGDDRTTILIHANTVYPFKGLERGKQFCQVLVNYLQETNQINNFRILALGTEKVWEIPKIIGLGTLSHNRVADLLGSQVDLVIDPSHSHSYGMPTAEALACGVPACVWGDNKGIEEFNDCSGLHLLDDNYTKAAQYVTELALKSHETSRKSLLSERHNRRKNIPLFCERLHELIGEKKSKITIVSPHIRKHGGPTTIIHMANELKKRHYNIDMKIVYSDYSPSILRSIDVPVSFNWDVPVPTDVLIVNSDSDKHEYWENYPANHKILLKLSHNKRFQTLEEQGINGSYEQIWTSTPWLREACLREGDGWRFKLPEPDQVHTIGWTHYSHNNFAAPERRSRTENTSDTGLIVGFLVHDHPLKGTQDALKIIEVVGEKHPMKVIAIGEVPNPILPDWVQYFYNPDRKKLSKIFKQLDIWVSASYTEGLGRLTLEAMSACAGVVCTNTGADFLKPGINCLQFEPGDIASGTQALKDIYTNDTRRNALIRNAYDTAEKAADPTKYIDTIIKRIKALQ